ncbi:MAG: HAD family hydrolase [Treponema sp.]|jgi:hydroxymethylpyrimidine pyrophosphatase-like HAD family hydrolase|nr:HAD family hydrolase [Treponema sp.]
MPEIEAVAKNENVELSEIAAFGDDCIDKEIAKYICESNNDSGVERWLEKNIL